MGAVSEMLFIALPIVGSMMLAWGIFQVTMDLRTAKQRRVVDRLMESGTGKHEQQVKESLLRKRAAELQAGALDTIVSRLQVVAKLQRVLDQADVDWSASKVLRNLALASVAVSAGMMLLKISPIGCVGASVGVFTLPLLALIRKRKNRVKRLVQQLPDVFDLMGQALRAGHSLASAIQLISQQMPDPIASEFARIFHEQNLGIKIEEALLNMAKRVDQMDVPAVARFYGSGSIAVKYPALGTYRIWVSRARGAFSISPVVADQPIEGRVVR